MKKKILGTILSISITLSSFCGTSYAKYHSDSHIFDDVESNDWFSGYVLTVKEKGLMSGVSEREFSPYTNVTRAMFVTVLYRLDGEPKTNGASPFKDVSKKAYYANAVIWASEKGIISGMSDTEFAPNAEITREQTAAVIARYADHKGASVNSKKDATSSFKDASKISSWAKTGMAFCVSEGILSGDSNKNLNPKGFATRAEISVIITKTAAFAEKKQTSAQTVTLSDIPSYSGAPYAEINNNIPFFYPYELVLFPFEVYSPLDSLGRCGAAYANVCGEIMPTEKRSSISSIKPSGWQTVKYDFIDGKYLYNRCHLIGYQLTSENANDQNLITGTRYLNVVSMLPFENMVASYVSETGNHVIYRVTPLFDEDDLVACGVLMEAYSVEDKGRGICYNVFCYNVQPGVIIDYSTGKSAPDTNAGPAEQTRASSSLSHAGNTVEDKPVDTEPQDAETEDTKYVFVKILPAAIYRAICSLLDLPYISKLL